MAGVASLLEELETTLSEGSPERRREICLRMTDLFMSGSGRFSAEQLALFDDVLTSLSRSIETEARARLARHLAPIKAAPRGVVRSLATDDAIEVAGPILEKSPCLDDDDLIACAQTQSQKHLQAIARRAALTEAVTDVLVIRGDRRTVRAVARNAGARFSEDGFERLVAHANDDDALAGVVGMRRDIPRHHFLKLLDAASASVREKLVVAAPRARDVISATVFTIVGEMQRKSRDDSSEHFKAKASAKRLYTARTLGESDLHAGASAQNFEKTVATLALLGHYPVEMVERAVLDAGVEMILLLLKAAGCSRATAKSVLLMSAADRGLSPDDLESALAAYTRLRETTAKRIIAFHQRQQKKQKREAASAPSRRQRQAEPSLAPSA